MNIKLLNYSCLHYEEQCLSEDIQQVNVTIYLGLIVDNKLTWSMTT